MTAADEVGARLDQVFQEAWTKPLPKSAGAQVRYLVRQYKDTQRVADLLGVTRRTVERYVNNQIKHPRPQLAARLAQQVKHRWQPGNVAKARKAAAHSTGLMIEIEARIGYRGAPGTTDEDRIRHLTVALPPYWAKKLLDAQARGVNENKLREVTAEALRETYFQDRGTRAHGLQEVRLTDVLHVTFGL